MAAVQRESHGLEFPTGVLHEDIAVVLRAHVLARSVDVIKAPVYLYREREEGTWSITQRRTELRSLVDRLSAVEQASAFLADRRPERLKRWYDESVVEDDLRYHLDVLDEAGKEYRALFLERANAFLDRADPGVEDRLPAIQRLKWYLIRRRMLGELLDVVRFQKAGGAARKVRIRGRSYGDYPFLDDPGLGIPRSVFRLDTARRRARHAGAAPAPVPDAARTAPAAAHGSCPRSSPPPGSRSRRRNLTGHTRRRRRTPCPVGSTSASAPWSWRTRSYEGAVQRRPRSATTCWSDRFPGTVYGLPRDATAHERMTKQSTWFGAHQHDRII